MQNVAACFVPAVRVIQAVVVDHVTGPPCQIPRGLTLVPVTGRSTSPYRRPLHTKRKIGFGALFGGRGRERVAFHASAAECTAPHSRSQISPLLRLPL
jgi:hypothetical protein